MTAKTSQPRYQVDRQNALHPQAFIFARAEWTIEGDHPDSLVIHPASVEPGSWCKPPEWFSRYAMSCGKVYAFISCPNCHNVSMVADRVTKCDLLGHLTPDLACTHSGCGFRRVAYLDNWNDRVLYACSYWEGANIKIAYTHGNTVAMARRELGASCRDEDIIAIGPAIGFFVDEEADRTGNILTAD
jgi:hypothetical protein